jgi:hypothetical protein
MLKTEENIVQKLLLIALLTFGAIAIARADPSAQNVRLPVAKVFLSPMLKHGGSNLKIQVCYDGKFQHVVYIKDYLEVPYGKRMTILGDDYYADIDERNNIIRFHIYTMDSSSRIGITYGPSVGPSTCPD